MKLDRIPPNPTALIEFYEDALGALGAVCSRSWHDRLEVLAEGPAARLWNATGELHEVELRFGEPASGGVRDGQREVFPGCPLTFRLAETLCPAPPVLERAILAAGHAASRTPEVAVAEKLWRTQFPDTVRWRQLTPFVAAWHFSLVALVRCELQALDQQWSLHRLAWSLPDGTVDETLAHDIGFASVDAGARVESWPCVDPEFCGRLLASTLEQQLAADVAGVRERQENRLRHELARIEAYFANYERELVGRAGRSASTKLKLQERIAAARAECERHRADQVQRHEIAIVPHVDSLLLVAEPAWRSRLQIDRTHGARSEVQATLAARARRWTVDARSE